MADPDEALIEAIAEAIHAGCDPRRHDGLVTTVHEWEARAALAAVVAHLGLVEETCCDHIPDDYRAYTCAELGSTCITRLAQRWPDRTEVDHGSE